jgi:uncharacterized protein YdaU (DUF1376 family)
MGLSLLQHGAYTLLLDHLYATETRIPDRAIAFQICRAVTGEEQSAVSEILEKFFKKTAAGFTNNRFERELKTRKDWCKWQKNHRVRKPDKAMTVRPMSSRSPSPSPSPSKEREETSKSKHAPGGAKQSFPTSFELSAQMRSFAIDRGVANPDAEFEAFSDHHKSRGNRFTDWVAAWRTWCRNSEKFRGRRPNAGESFDERRQRKSEAALGEIGARAHAVVSQVGRRLPEPRGN